MPRVTRDDVANAAGVSPSTVSRALNDSPLLPAATRQRVQSVAAELGYQINAAARQLAARRSFQLGFALPHGVGHGALQLGYYSEALNAAVMAADEQGYELVILLHEDGGGSFVKRLASLAAQQRFDGLIITGLRHDSRLPAQLARQRLPFVLLGCHKGRHTSVDYDPRPGLVGLVERLGQRGARSVCYLAGNPVFGNARDQEQAFRELLAAAGIELRHVLQGDYSLRQSMEQLRAHPEALACDAICCANDRSAIGAYNVLRQAGRRIGEDILVSGFDDDEHSRVLSPALTTIRQPRSEAGALAVRLLVDQLDQNHEPRTKRVPTRFVQRQSL